ncbi:MAG: M23 family metallopeptidase, partial [Halieaceae bacterium]|nr:M23 family metallopeptidase [Halieaceae bacterium]
LHTMQEAVDQQNQAVVELRADALLRLHGMDSSVAELDARLLTLNSMGQYLTSQLSGVDEREIVAWKPAMGGPLRLDPEPENSLNLQTEMKALSGRISGSEGRLEILQAMLGNWQNTDSISLAGKPTAKGWISSAYGRRNDPITGQKAWHKGVDFSSTAGSDIIAVAPGAVTWSGVRDDYGNMVEINHGGGYATRYAHNEKNLVAVGDLVKRGQVIAKMGSSGRSTGPHVHYEIFKHGRPVDPASYIARTKR